MGNQEFTKIILAKMHEVLKSHGFRKRGNTFAKECGDDVVLEVNFQKSSASSSTSLKVTVNLHVYSRTLTRAMGYSMNYPSDPHRHWRERIGGIMPQRRDKWWVAQTTQEAAQAGEEIAEALIHYGLPALNEVSSTEKLRVLWVHRRDNPDYIAALADPQQWQAEQMRRLEAALDRYEGETG